MKKTIILLLVTLLAIAPAASARVHKKAVAKPDTTEQMTAEDKTLSDSATSRVTMTKHGIVVRDNDGKQVEVKFGDVSRIVSEHLDDTLLSIDGMADVDENIDGESSDHFYREEYNPVQDGMKLARDICITFGWVTITVVFLALLFYYMHRRRKYKTVDRAIQAGYPLPNEFYGKRTPHVPQPTTVYINQITPSNDASATNAAPVMQTSSSNPLNNITDWAPYKSGFITTAVGLCLMLFFLINNAEAMAALMLIIVFIGMWKLFTTYQTQQSMKQYWQQQQWTQQAQQQVPVPPMPQQQEPYQGSVPPMPQDLGSMPASQQVNEPLR